MAFFLNKQLTEIKIYLLLGQCSEANFNALKPTSIRMFSSRKRCGLSPKGLESGGYI